MIFRGRAFARVGFLGNPSDGYFGKTISFTIQNFKAEVLLYESPDLEIIPGPRDHARFRSVKHLLADIDSAGYYGGVRLIKASIKKFYDYCSQNSIRPRRGNFTVRYSTSIPRGVGLAGSSAIITAAFRALMQFHKVHIPVEILPNLVLASETEELGIPAGLQDRVAQAYEGLVYMDFNREIMEKQKRGQYEVLDKELLPKRLYVAYRLCAAEPTERAHSDVKRRFLDGDSEVIQAMADLAAVAQEGRDCLLNRDTERLDQLINLNFDIRRRIYKINPKHLEMVTLARELGATSAFTGSGGAIVGTYRSQAMLKKLRDAMRRIGVRVILPRV